MNFDIIIIGGSFAGMTAALALPRDLKIAVIEKQDIVNHDRKRDGRAYAISSASLKLFHKIGIYDELQTHAGKISDIKITDHNSPFILDFLGREVDEKEDQLGQIIENFHIYNALRNQMLQRENIKIFSPNFYQKIEFLDDVKLELDDGKILEAKLLLACDGRLSRLRELYQIYTTRKDYHQTAIVFNISHQHPHQNVAYEKFFPGGPLAILPFKDQHQSSIVWVAKDEIAQAIIELDDKNFIHQLQTKMEDCLGEIEVISEKFSYPLFAIEADKFYFEKMLLVGDAACGVHPIAGQGFNLAISGIKILCELLEQNLFCGLKISAQSLIDAYNKKAKITAKKMLIATDILNSLFETKNFPISLARGFGLGLVNKLPRLKNFFIKSAGGF
ncbi:MAG: hypothetical protein A2887_06560 [Alphaproteobacteria bacterium RIFCSPLOWO2_01_FULL_40_26]|nr:MAG: hypothetical protein A3D15_01045 [Alphaproteobacteria bacterium RIFCSPHIGHO2_02_FULL_40_34]OFW94081.1 MAG: hypothetical protein A2887_06560 [Alphaproteobacteria bacterium RIFCSPLOWO2_01_FULL_40_26]OFX09587.1 MAG: hypothetical protein A3H30_00030 [Alphaproteobacteria bacterium RIFCSPLOWO2_02_FULL_40_19]OFX11248.1 MAG: hypothetical protein A3G22_00615 [Alphaproteobacteria bacterium RIFCSPLOWO2_12_FULL_40_11]